MAKGFVIDGNTVTLTDEFLQKLKYLGSNRYSVRNYIQNYVEDNKINIYYFRCIIKEHLDGTFEDFKTSRINPVSCPFDDELFEDILKKIEDFESKYTSFSHDLTGLDEMIDDSVELLKAERTMFLLREMNLYFKDIIIDMKYFKTEEEINNFKSLYSEAMKNKDIPKMEELFTLFQKDVLKEWDRCLSDPMSMDDENFLFLGHSTNSYSWEKAPVVTKEQGYENAFWTPIVSTSLFSQDMTDTFHAKFGFIMKPENIICAGPKDMQVNNNASSISSVLFYSRHPKINHPQRLLDECKKMKKENASEDSKSKVFSEVALQGFNPIGIFCFTNGCKELDSNYSGALLLKEKFPDLPIKMVDLFKIKKGEELRDLELDLLNKLNNQISTNEFNTITMADLPRFRYFFDKFGELRRSGNYTKDDILNLYNRNKLLIKPSEANTAKLFDGRYSHEEIKCILGGNYFIGIDYILAGKINLYSLQNLIYLKDFTPKLNKYYPGLGSFIELMKNFELTEEDILAFQNTEKKDFEEFTRIFKENIKTRLEASKNDASIKMEETMTKHNDLVDKKNEISRKINLYNRSFEITINKHFGDILINDIKDAIRIIEESVKRLEVLRDEKMMHEGRLFDLMAQYNSQKDAVYVESTDVTIATSDIEKLKSEIHDLSSSVIKRFINRKKISKKNQLIKEKEEFVELKEKGFEMGQKSALSGTEYRIELSQEELDLVYDKIRRNEENIRFQKGKLESLYQRVETLFGVKKTENIDELANLIKTSINNAYDYINNSESKNELSANLEIVESQIKELEDLILTYQSTIQNVEEQEMRISL